MKRLCIIGVVLACLLAGCQPISRQVQSNSRNDISASAGQSDGRQNTPAAVPPSAPSEIRWNSQISLPFPPPNASSYVSVNYGEVDCIGAQKKDLDDYRAALKKAGWKEVGVEGASSCSGPLQLTYIKGNDVVSLLDQTFEEPTSYAQPLIRIDYGSGYHGGYSDGRKTPEQAKPVLQKFLNVLPKGHYMSGRIISGIKENDIGDAYSKMGLQCFAVYCADNRGDTFLLGKNNSVIEACPKHFCTADIDGDGKDEFLSMIGFGSGIYRIVLSAYQYDKNGALKKVYGNCWVPKSGYGDLTIVKVNERTVKLFDIKSENGKLVPDPNKDYGALKVSGKKLVCQSPAFPFEEWNN